VSHELKTPIGALMLLAETLSDTDDTAALMSLAPRVQHEAERLARIVEDLLDLSLLEAQAEPEREPIAVVDLLNETAERVRSSADAAGIKIVVDEPSSRLRARLDRRWIGSALVNLLDNAVKYSDPGGVVTVGAAAEGDELVIDVRDEGIGIPTRDLDRIFERFYRVDRARSRATGGTGLGLSIVRHVAEAHHGSVSAHSTEGVGSVFHLSLPGAVAARPSLSEAS
jgi:two-component system sensor histidine kinase SenX3